MWRAKGASEEHVCDDRVDVIERLCLLVRTEVAVTRRSVEEDREVVVVMTLGGVRVHGIVLRRREDTTNK